jgi:hypothetical protein
MFLVFLFITLLKNSCKIPGNTIQKLRNETPFLLRSICILHFQVIVVLGVEVKSSVHVLVKILILIPEGYDTTYVPHHAINIMIDTFLFIGLGIGSIATLTLSTSIMYPALLI